MRGIFKSHGRSYRFFSPWRRHEMSASLVRSDDTLLLIICSIPVPVIYNAPDNGGLPLSDLFGFLFVILHSKRKKRSRERIPRDSKFAPEKSLKCSEFSVLLFEKRSITLTRHNAHLI